LLPRFCRSHVAESVDELPDHAQKAPPPKNQVFKPSALANRLVFTVNFYLSVVVGFLFEIDGDLEELDILKCDNYSAILSHVIPQGGIFFRTRTVLEMKKDSHGMTVSFVPE
jgi:hypothetical protein